VGGRAHIGVSALQALALAVELRELGTLADQRRTHGELHGVAAHAVAADAQLLRHRAPVGGKELALEEDADRVEAAAVDLARAMAAERVEVLGRAVAL